MRNILILEDNESDLSIMKYLLNKNGYVPFPFKDPYEAIEQLDKVVVHLILLDWQLPRMSGIDFLRRLKKSEQYRDIPVIMMSGRNELKDVKMALHEGAVDYIIKPIDPLIVQNKIEKFLTGIDNWQIMPLSSDQETTGSLPLRLELKGISEVGLEFSGPIGLNKGENYDIEFAALKKLDIQQVPIRILEAKHDSTQKVVRYIGSFIGLKEGDLKKIRLFCRSLNLLKQSA
ncbi:MAG: PleD family two-component system response regulator [Pseudobdellovibrio sp.]